MPGTIAEADWKVLRRVHPLALERYCERVLAEIEPFTHNSAQSTLQRYLDMFKIVEQRDREMASSLITEALECADDACPDSLG